MARPGQAAVQRRVHASVLCSVTDLSGLPLLDGISRSFTRYRLPLCRWNSGFLQKPTDLGSFRGGWKPGPGKYLDQVDSTQSSFILPSLRVLLSIKMEQLPSAQDEKVSRKKRGILSFCSVAEVSSPPTPLSAVLAMAGRGMAALPTTTGGFPACTSCPGDGQCAGQHAPSEST